MPGSDGWFFFNPDWFGWLLIWLHNPIHKMKTIPSRFELSGMIIIPVNPTTYDFDKIPSP